MTSPADVAFILCMSSTLFFIVSTLCVPSKKLYPKLSELGAVLCMATFVVTCYLWLLWFSLKGEALWM